MKTKIELWQRPLVLVDFETTGPDEQKYEIIEIGAIRFDQNSFEILGTFDKKVKPLYPGLITDQAQKINGYNRQDWEDAQYLHDVLPKFINFAKGGVFLAYNVHFDRKFYNWFVRRLNLKDKMDYHSVCIMSGAMMMLRQLGLKNFQMKDVANFLGIPEEPMPHRAINGAKTDYEIYKKLMTGFEVCSRVHPSIH